MKLSKFDLLFIVLICLNLAAGVYGLAKGERISTLALILSEMTTLGVYGYHIMTRKN